MITTRAIRTWVSTLTASLVGAVPNRAGPFPGGGASEAPRLRIQKNPATVRATIPAYTTVDLSLIIRSRRA
jgi:hypothetical protein